ncbi:glycosyltransferase family 4 protein [Oscillatoria sp. FACHB-1407]|uniref:glycosyltransferase family 4 protein n=1 Tax=Oscillatoria sp. FACHB-1407 TaxID=2692847 RepID=UPI001688AF00|nr:glycosyltransferase family 4 protein [Oscillatoria sp. FACHB-1407]MBD2459680.1 glycosyltransferase family 4 protein [Oscillatoria sp. FACHB-1407]
MKIAFINPPWTLASPDQTYDSIGIWSSEIASRLAKSCHVIFYGKRGSGCSMPVQVVNQVEYRSIPVELDEGLKFLGLLHLLRFPGPGFPFFMSSLRYLNYCLRVAFDIRRQKCDVVHIQNFYQFAPWIRLINPNVKIILHMHSEWLNWFSRSVARRRLKCVDFVIGCSEHVTQKILVAFPELADRIYTVYNGVDIDNFSRQQRKTLNVENGSKTLLFVGRVSPEKGVHILIDAFNQIGQQDPNVDLVLVGPEAVADKRVIVLVNDDPKVQALEQLYLELQQSYDNSYLSYLKARISPDLVDRVKFVGVVERDHLPSYYHNADILVNPSFSETFGMSLVEGMASAVPVIGSRVGGMVHIIQEGTTGLFVESGDVSSLVNAVMTLLKQDRLRQDMGKAGYEQALNCYSWDKIADRLLALYQAQPLLEKVLVKQYAD